MKFIYLLSLVSLTFASVARAEAIPGLTRYFGNKLTSVQTALDSAQTSPGEAFVFQDLNIDIAPEVTFGLNSFVSLTIAPEIDFVLTPTVQ